MHYRNGREAKQGDLVIGKNYDGTPVSGIVVRTAPGSDTCNLYIAPVGLTQCHTASECLHFEDALPQPVPKPQPAPEPVTCDSKPTVTASVLPLVLLLLSLCLSGAGCKTTTREVVTDGVTNQVSFTELDTNKLARVEKALEPVAASATRRALRNSPQHAEEIGNYLRSVGGVFCDMQASGHFDPAYLIGAADHIVTPKLDDDTVIDVKNAVISIYEIAWGDRFTVAFPPDQWMAKVSELICNSIDRGLKDAGQTGIKP